MVNKEELAVCKRRGHDANPVGEGWSQCKWCGMWLRKRMITEEREDDPPKDERNQLDRYYKDPADRPSGR